MTDRPAPRPAGDADHRRRRSGPADVSVDVFVAAQRGDSRAFAAFVEHWDEHLRPFVHLSLCEPESTDRVLQAAYLRAHRALPRYRPDQTPGQWLHRHAYAAVVDEIRRSSRQRTRQKRRVDATSSSSSSDTGDVGRRPDPVKVLGGLPLDQRAIVVMVDHERYRVESVADTFGAPPAVISEQLVAARRFLAQPKVDSPGSAPLPSARQRAQAEANPAGVLGGPRSSSSPPTSRPDGRQGPARTPGRASVGRSDPFAVPAWMADESVNIVDRDPLGSSPHDPTTSAPVATRVLRALHVPPPSASFWNGLGQLLLAELARPPAVDPHAETVTDSGLTAGTEGRSNRRQGIFARRRRPASVDDEPTVSGAPSPADASSRITTIAERAERTRAPRQWGVPVAIVVTAAGVVAAVIGAIAIGVSDPIPDGTAAPEAVSDRLAQTFAAAEYLTAEVEVDRPNADPAVTDYGITVARNGSWAVSRRDVIDLVTYDTAGATARRITAAAAGPDEPPIVLAADQAGLSGGPPDVDPVAPEPIQVLRDLGPLMRSAPDLTVGQRSEAGTDIWTFSRTVGSGADGSEEQWSVVLRRSDGLPLVVERRAGRVLVSRVSYSAWEPKSEVPDDAFRPKLPAAESVRSTDDGFIVVGLDAVGLLGRGEAVTPTWLPPGFEFASVVIRGQPVDGGSASDAENPSSTAVASISYRRGADRVTITTRAAEGRGAERNDPFDRAPRSDVGDRTLGDGRFNQTTVEVVAAPAGRAHLWGTADDVVFTVGGDLTEDEVFRVANSLR